MSRTTSYTVVHTSQTKVGMHDASRPWAVLAEEHGSSYRSINSTHVVDRYATRQQAMRRKRNLEIR